MTARKTTGKASLKTLSTSDLKVLAAAQRRTSAPELVGNGLASAYEERMAVRVERASLLPVEAASSDAQPQGSSPELASLAGRYLKADSLDDEDVDNVRSLAASVLSQKTTD